jgi:hypothetical protein
MELKFSKESINFYLKKLDFKDVSRSVFYSEVHDYKLQPPIDKKLVFDFESATNIILPLDYRYFITEIGNGGAGPNYGLYPFQLDRFGNEPAEWTRNFEVEVLAKPFPHRDSWNLSSSFWEQQPDFESCKSWFEQEALTRKWEEQIHENYYKDDLTNGTIAISDLGCGMGQLLVVTGERKGTIWADERMDGEGIIALKDKNGEPLTFSNWYLEWLEDNLKEFEID